MGSNSRRKRDRAHNHVQRTRRKERLIKYSSVSSDKKTTLKLGLLNIDGLSMSKLHDITSTTMAEALDIIVVLETKRSQEDCHEDITIPGYSCYETLRSEANGDKDGGGVAMYCRLAQGLVCTKYTPEIEDPEEYFVNSERQWILIQSDNYTKTAVCGVYMERSSWKNRDSQWNDHIYSRLLKEVVDLRAEGFRVVVQGDFNGWVGAELASGGIPGNRREINKNGRMFLDFLHSSGMVHVNGATKVKGDWSTKLTSGLWTRQRAGTSTILDYSAVSEEFMDTVVCMVIDDRGGLGGGSDHNWQILTLRDSFSSKSRANGLPVKKTIWNHSKVEDWKPFTGVVTSLMDHVDTTDVDKFGTDMVSALVEGLKRTVGRKTVSNAPRVKTLPGGIVSEIKKKRALEKVFKSAQTRFSAGNPDVSKVYVDKSEEVFLAQKSRVDVLISQYKTMKRREVSLKCMGTDKGSTKLFWSFISEKQKKSSDITALIHPQTKVLKCEPADVKDIAEKFIIDLFQGTLEPPNTTTQEPVVVEQEQDEEVTSVQGEHSYSVKPSPRLSSMDDSKTLQRDPANYCDADFTFNEVQSGVKTLKAGKAAGWDTVPNEAIINSGTQFIMMLTVLYNMMKKSGKTPKGWNKGRLILVHKKGPTENISNYRPLTVIISLCGLFSRILNARLSAVCESFKLLGEIQNGFRQGRCCADNNFILHTILWKARAMGTRVHCAYVDLMKAYDMVSTFGVVFLSILLLVGSFALIICVNCKLCTGQQRDTVGEDGEARIQVNLYQLHQVPIPVRLYISNYTRTSDKCCVPKKGASTGVQPLSTPLCNLYC